MNCKMRLCEQRLVHCMCFRYRGFPNIKAEKVDVSSPRSHVCNFLGTVYGNSSREILSQMIKSLDLQDTCIILERKR